MGVTSGDKNEGLTNEEKQPQEKGNHIAPEDELLRLIVPRWDRPISEPD